MSTYYTQICSNIQLMFAYPKGSFGYGKGPTKPATLRRAEARYVHGLVALKQKLRHRYPLKIERGKGRNVKSPLKTCFTGRKTLFFLGNYRPVSLFSCQKASFIGKTLIHGHFYGQSFIAR